MCFRPTNTSFVLAFVTLIQTQIAPIKFFSLQPFFAFLFSVRLPFFGTFSEYSNLLTVFQFVHIKTRTSHKPIKAL